MARSLRRLAIAALLALAFAHAPATAAPLRTFYVDPAGNDSAAGSSMSPWRTLQKAANTVRAGDLVIVRAGHYAGMYLTTSGTSADPITFRGEPGAIVDSQNPTTQDGINLEGASYIVIEGFTVTGVPRAGIRAVLNHHVIIRGNTGDLNGRWGILTGFSDDILIEDNVMSRSQAEHGIYVSNSGDRPIIRGNVVWGNNANGIHMNGDLSQGGDGIISGALVEDNVIFNNGVAGGSGINGDGVQDSVFRNNLLYGNHASGISLYRIDGAQGSRNNQILHNTIVQASDARWAINVQNASTGNVVRNNILYNFHSFRGSIAIAADSLTGFVSDTNVVMDRFSADGGNTRITLAQWRSATGQDLASLIATPSVLFVDTAANDYHLSATSPARNAGATLASVTDDLEGSPRPQGASSDIGAYEYPESPGQVTLTVSKTGSGTVTSNPSGIDCGATCVAAFGAGSSVSLTAVAASGWVFSGWSGGGCSGAGGCAVTLATSTTVTATFTLAPVTLSVVRAGLGSGSVTSAPSGISCGTTCSASFPSGGAVILTATAATGSTFAGWSGGGCTGTGTCTVTLVSATTVIATFSPVMFMLNVSIQGAGTGGVSSAPVGISCGATCAASFASSTSVTLTPAPTTGSVFAGWSGACTGTAGCTVTMDQARTVTASFSRVFTDATLTARVTTIRAVHVSELRGAIDTLRSRQGLAAFAWTDASPTAGATPIRRVHLVEMRTALTAVFTARGLPAPTWTDSSITAGTTAIKAAHITELRTATLALP